MGERLCILLPELKVHPGRRPLVGVASCSDCERGIRAEGCLPLAADAPCSDCERDVRAPRFRAGDALYGDCAIDIRVARLLAGDEPYFDTETDARSQRCSSVPIDCDLLLVRAVGFLSAGVDGEFVCNSEFLLFFSLLEPEVVPIEAIGISGVALDMENIFLTAIGVDKAPMLNFRQEAARFISFKLSGMNFWFLTV